jgi:peptide/nickel transport system ATP-binding protein
VQIIHQDPYASLNPTHSIYSTLSFPLFRHGLARNYRQARERVAQLLHTVDLTPVGDVIDKYPHQLSGGQRQRVSIARALTTNPSVIVADEAVSMVDVSIRISILNMLMAMQADLGVTLVFITHDLALAKYFAWKGRIAVMYLGRVVEIGRTPEITENPQHPYTRVLLSAIPEPDPDRTRTKQHVALRSEDIPRLTELPPGCAFHPRCPWFVPGVCDHEIPMLAGVPLSESDAQVACIPLTEGAGLRLYD